VVANCVSILKLVPEILETVQTAHVSPFQVDPLVRTMLAALPFKTLTMPLVKDSTNSILDAYQMVDFTALKTLVASFVSILLALDLITATDPFAIDSTTLPQPHPVLLEVIQQRDLQALEGSQLPVVQEVQLEEIRPNALMTNAAKPFSFQV